MKTKSTYASTLLCMSTALILGSFAQPAAAEVTLLKQPKWELFTDGRVGGFLSYTNGDGFPKATPTSTVFGGGISTNDANQIDDTPPLPQSKLRSFRLRSGFLSNIFAFGARTQLGDTKVTTYIQFWSDIESESRRKYVPAPVDVRQGYVKLEGSWGDLIVGRQGTLFSRGAAEIDFLYGHGYGVGFPTAIDSNGTTAGHVGTGVLGPGFGAGMVYVTPNLAGLRLNAGLFDPVIIVGAWERTEYPRPEAELTFDRSFGTNAKLHLFVNGAYQPVYRTGEPDSTSTAAYGAGYGARAEFGPVHIGVAGHTGQGLGLYYALESSEASADATPAHRLRKSDGYYAQLQVALAHVDLNAGVGVSRVIPLKAETRTIAGASVYIPADGTPDGNGLRQSLIQYQLGMSAAVVYHFSENLHFDFDYFRASFKWQLGEKQNVNFFNSGLTATW